ncbi:XRE family transcriptional regulator [Sedimenticola thiotaurini]|uniref:XRE family transcriptional regulator n=2 Tax=Sedimenticola thiotaurini TaxID=1543721 RepID=A0A0F7JZ26_9GAMM|nr:XRE family transcriptional regulator [Sedimenticola thiotaurini]
MLSKIERGQASPSLSALHRLAKALNTNVAELTAQEEAVRSPVMRADERPVVNFGSGRSGIQLERLVAPARSQLLQGDIHLLAPGTESEEMIHHVGEEFGYVLEGELELKLGDNTYTLSAGDSFYFASEIPHSYRNTGKVTTRVLWINTPPTF